MSEKSLISKEEANCSEMLCNFLDQTNDQGAGILNLVEHYVNHFNARYANLDFHARQDIRQEVSIILLCHGEKVRDNCSRAWVYKIVRNQCINYVRKHTKLATLHKPSSSSDPESDETGLIPSLNEASNVRLFQQMDCLQKIFTQIESQTMGKEDIALYTQYAFGLSYQEISKQTKRTVNAVGRRISILKSRLKKLADECC